MNLKRITNLLFLFLLKTFSLSNMECSLPTDYSPSSQSSFSNEYHDNIVGNKKVYSNKKTIKLIQSSKNKKLITKINSLFLGLDNIKDITSYKISFDWTNRHNPYFEPPSYYNTCIIEINPNSNCELQNYIQCKIIIENEESKKVTTYPNAHTDAYTDADADITFKLIQEHKEKNKIILLKTKNLPNIFKLLLKLIKKNKPNH